MKNFLIKHPDFKRSLLVLFVVIFSFGVASLFHPFRRDIRVTTQIVIAHVSAPAAVPFPKLNTAGLTPTQNRIVKISAQQYALKPVSYNAAVLQYTQGSKEAWCADFASWVYQQAGAPFSNPDSGSWRIPGVYTLQAYFQAKHAFVPVGSYQPKAGDIAIYNHSQGHAAIVLSRKGNAITTIGGNENGRLRIDTRNQTGSGNYDLAGFGILPAK